MSSTVCSDTARSRLRGIAAKIDDELSRLSGQAAAGELGVSISELLKNWADLISVLDLGPAPQLRKCPECGRLGAREAALCGYCWKKLETLDSGKPATG